MFFFADESVYLYTPASDFIPTSWGRRYGWIPLFHPVYDIFFLQSSDFHALRDTFLSSQPASFSLSNLKLDHPHPHIILLFLITCANHSSRFMCIFLFNLTTCTLLLTLLFFALSSLSASWTVAAISYLYHLHFVRLCLS